MSTSFLKLYLRASVLMTAGNACAYLFQLVMAQSLSPADFGASNALLAVSILLVAPLTVAPSAISKMLLDHAEEPLIFAALVRRTVVTVLVLSVAIFLLFQPFTSMVQNKLQVDSVSAQYLLPLLTVSYFLCQMPVGIWQGERNYMLVSAGNAGVPILRLVFGVGLVTLADGGLIGAMAALILGAGAVYCIGLWEQRHYFALTGGVIPPGTVSRMLRFILPASLSTTGLLALAYIDLPLVRAFNSPESSGLYAAASTLAKIALLLPSALIGIVFPEAAALIKAERGQRASLRLIGMALGFTVAVSGAAAGGMMLLPEFCLSVMTGKAYVASAPLLRILAPAMALLAIVMLLVTYALARGSYTLVVPTVLATPILFAVAQVYQPAPQQTAWLLLTTMSALSAACIVWLIVTHQPLRTTKTDK